MSVLFFALSRRNSRLFCRSWRYPIEAYGSVLASGL